MVQNYARVLDKQFRERSQTKMPSDGGERLVARIEAELGRTENDYITQIQEGGALLSESKVPQADRRRLGEHFQNAAEAVQAMFKAMNISMAR